MQNTTNVFLEGIITDQNPLTMPETAMTSALNATFLTLNGNELLLLNDMGNTLVKDSITGNVMSLSDGFIPLGMKEHGGVLYIASYNPATGDGELGTIPSPILHYTFDSKLELDINLLLTNLNPDEVTVSDVTVGQRIKDELIYVISDHLFHGGDKFIVALNIDGINNMYGRPYRTLRETTGYRTLRYPTISYVGDGENLVKGWYRIELYAVTESQSPILINTITGSRLEYVTTDGVSHESPYWFISSSELDADLDPDKTRLSNYFKTFPNGPAGRLAIKIVPEYPLDLQYIVNQTYDMKVPTVQVEMDKSGNEILIKNWISFPGFTYIAEGAIQPDKLIIECNEGSIPIYYWDGTKLLSCSAYTIDVSPTPEMGTANTNKDKFPCVDTSLVEEKPAKSTLAFCTKLTGTKNQYLISKYRPKSEQYPARNYTSSNSDGLFFVLLENLNTELTIRIKRYVKHNGNYVLYQDDNTVNGWQYMDPFNPTLMAVSSSTITPLQEVIPNISFLDQDEAKEYLANVGYTDLNGTESADTFDVEFYKKSKLKCFVYDQHSDGSYRDDVNKFAIKVYDHKAHKYRWREIILWDGYKTLLESFGYDPKQCGYDEHAYNKRQTSPFDNLTNRNLDVDAAFVPTRSNVYGAKHTLLSYQNLRTWIYPQYVADYNDYNSISNTKNVEFIWNKIFRSTYKSKCRDTYNPYYNNELVQCVASAVRPDVKINISGLNTTRELLLPIKGNYQYFSSIEAEMKALQNYFKEKYNYAGLTAAGMKEYCLYLTNLHTINVKTPPDDWSYIPGLEHNFANFDYSWLKSDNEYSWTPETDTCTEGFWRPNNYVYRIGDTEFPNATDSCLCLFYNDKTYSILDSDNLGMSVGPVSVSTTQEYKKSSFRSLQNIDNKPTNNTANPEHNFLGVIPYISQEVYGSGPFHPIGAFSKPSQTAIGFVNNVIKYCPGYIPTRKETSIIDITPVDFNFPMTYLYKETSIGDATKYTIDIVNRNPNLLLMRSFIGALAGGYNTEGVGGITMAYSLNHTPKVIAYSWYETKPNLFVDLTINKLNYSIELPKALGFIDFSSLLKKSIPFYENSSQRLSLSKGNTRVNVNVTLNVFPHDKNKDYLTYVDSVKDKEQVIRDTSISANLSNVYNGYYLGHQEWSGDKRTERLRLQEWVDDLFITVYSPQLFTDLSLTTLRDINYLSDYKFNIVLGALTQNNASTAFYFNGQSYITIVAGSNVDKTNLLVPDSTVKFFAFGGEKSPSKIYTENSLATGNRYDDTPFNRDADFRLSRRSAVSPIVDDDTIELQLKRYYWGINTFCNEDARFYQIPNNKNIGEINTINLLSQCGSIELEGNRLYVLNVNYNYLKQKYFKLQLEINGIKLDFPDHRSFLLFYVPTQTVVSSLKLNIITKEALKTSNTPAYIKNIGLMEVLENADNELPEGHKISNILNTYSVNTNITGIPDQLVDDKDKSGSFIYDSVLFEPVFCYKEEDENGGKIGCMYYTYSGFQALPDETYQKCLDIFRYGYKTDRIMFESEIKTGYLREHQNSNEIGAIYGMIDNLGLKDYKFRTLRGE